MIERTVSPNGFDFHVSEVGSGDRLALCLHGFPELGYGWRHQLPVLADLGYRAFRPLKNLVVMNAPHPALFQQGIRTLDHLYPLSGGE